MIRIYGYDGIYSAIDLPGQTCGLEAADGNGEIHCYRLLDDVTAMRMRQRHSGCNVESFELTRACW